MCTLLFSVALVSTAAALTCYEGTLEGLTNNSRTAEKHCSGISNYCIQKIDKKKNQIRRECSSFTDEHNMEEKCPMSGCHWQSAHETYCCCQFDYCNEWKSDGTEYKKGETIAQDSAADTTLFSSDGRIEYPKLPEPKPRYNPSRIPATRTDEIRLD